MSTLRFVENVNGVIVGEVAHRVKLIAPNGNAQAFGNISTTDNSAEWGNSELAKIRSSELGNGQLLSDRPDIEALIYGKGEWTIRTY